MREKEKDKRERDREERERERKMSCMQCDHYSDYMLPFFRIARL